MALRLVPNDRPDVVACTDNEPEIIDGRKVHKCCMCPTEGVWNKNWAWYGSLIDGENGKVDKVCSAECREKYNSQHRIPHSNRGLDRRKTAGIC